MNKTSFYFNPVSRFACLRLVYPTLPVSRFACLRLVYPTLPISLECLCCLPLRFITLHVNWVNKLFKMCLQRLINTLLCSDNLHTCTKNFVCLSHEFPFFCVYCFDESQEGICTNHWQYILSFRKIKGKTSEYYLLKK
jgi:hypothetical protein